MRQDIKDKDGCDVEPEDSKDCRNRSEDHPCADPKSNYSVVPDEYAACACLSGTILE